MDEYVYALGDVTRYSRVHKDVVPHSRCVNCTSVDILFQYFSKWPAIRFTFLFTKVTDALFCAGLRQSQSSRIRFETGVCTSLPASGPVPFERLPRRDEGLLKRVEQ